MAFTDRHEKTVARQQPVDRVTRRHFHLAIEQPNVLGHTAACGVRRKTDATAWRKLDVHDVDIGRGAGRRDGAPEVARLRIPPDLLLLPARQRRGLTLLGKERRKRQTERCANSREQRGCRASFTTFDPRDHRTADTRGVGEVVERHILLHPQLADANGDRLFQFLFHYSIQYFYYNRNT